MSTHIVKIGSLVRELPVVEIRPGLSIAILNILGDTELVEEAAAELHNQLRNHELDFLVVPAVKAIPLAHALARRMHLPYVVLRKELKIYETAAARDLQVSVTSGLGSLVLTTRDEARILKTEHRRCLLVDDVVSTGSTLEAAKTILTSIGARVMGCAAIAVEGGSIGDWVGQVTFLVHLPLL